MPKLTKEDRQSRRSSVEGSVLTIDVSNHGSSEGGHSLSSPLTYPKLSVEEAAGRVSLSLPMPLPLPLVE